MPDNASIRAMKRLDSLLKRVDTRQDFCGALSDIEGDLYDELQNALDKRAPIDIRDLANELEFTSRSRVLLCKTIRAERATPTASGYRRRRRSYIGLVAHR